MIYIECISIEATVCMRAKEPHVETVTRRTPPVETPRTAASKATPDAPHVGSATKMVRFALTVSSVLQNRYFGEVNSPSKGQRGSRIPKIAATPQQKATKCALIQSTIWKTDGGKRRGYGEDKNRVTETLEPEKALKLKSSGTISQTLRGFITAPV
jgi:hypothetical protein